MFFQIVTRLRFTCYMMVIGAFALAPSIACGGGLGWGFLIAMKPLLLSPHILHWLPCPVTTGKGLGLGVVIGNLGGGSPTTIIAAALAGPTAEMSPNLPKNGQLWTIFRQNRQQICHVLLPFPVQSLLWMLLWAEGAGG